MDSYPPSYSVDPRARNDAHVDEPQQITQDPEARFFTGSSPLRHRETGDPVRPRFRNSRSESSFTPSSSASDPIGKQRPQRRITDLKPPAESKGSSVRARDTDPFTPSPSRKKRARLDGESEVEATDRHRHLSLSPNSVASSGSSSRTALVHDDPFDELEDAPDSWSNVSGIPESPSPAKEAGQGKDLHSRLTPRQIDGNIKRRLRKSIPPRKSDGRPGYVYVAFSEDRKELVKIGHTVGEPDQRKKEIERACGIKFTSFEATQGRFADYLIVEALARLELAALRSNEPCPNPTCKHREWFKIKFEDAVGVVERWTRFTTQGPWETDTTMRPFWDKRLNKVAHPPASEGTTEWQARAQRWQKFTTLNKWEELLYFLETQLPWYVRVDRVRYWWCILAPILSPILATRLWLRLLVAALFFAMAS